MAKHKGEQFKTVIPERVSGEEKFHKTLSGAKQAFRPWTLVVPPRDFRKNIAVREQTIIQQHPKGEIFELVNGTWELIHTIPEDNTVPYTRHFSKLNYVENYFYWIRETRPWK